MALEYAQGNPLDVEAAVEAVYLRAYALGEYAEAGHLGLEALRRVPADKMLINNTAYALAMSGRGAEASQLLQSVQDVEDPYLIATRGLVALATGDAESGLALYDEAADVIARTAPDDDRDPLLRVLRANEVIALVQLNLKDKAFATPELESIHAPDDWESDSRFKMLKLAASRIGVPWVTEGRPS